MAHEGSNVNGSPEVAQTQDSDKQGKALFLQPLTPKGISVYAKARLSQLLGVWMVFGIICSTSILWTVNQIWFPAIESAIASLPEKGEIVEGHLNYVKEPIKLVETKFLSIYLNPTQDDLSDTSDVQIVFGANELRLRSIFGWLWFNYPLNLYLPLNKQELLPWWGAYATGIKAAIFGFFLILLVIIWAFCGWLYSFPGRLIAIILRRNLDLAAGWKISCAGQMPAAIVACAALILYAQLYLDLTGFVIAFLAHFLVGWSYIFISIFYLEKIQVEPKNPFLPEPKVADSSSKKSDNPFMKN